MACGSHSVRAGGETANTVTDSKFSLLINYFSIAAVMIASTATRVCSPNLNIVVTDGLAACVATRSYSFEILRTESNIRERSIASSETEIWFSTISGAEDDAAIPPTSLLADALVEAGGSTSPLALADVLTVSGGVGIERLSRLEALGEGDLMKGTWNP
jgi:hypothetical protein